MPSNPFELVGASFFQSSAMLGVIKSFEQPLKLQFSQFLMIFSSWWSSDLLMKTTSGDLASDEVLLMTSALQECFVFRTSFLQMFQASYLLISLLSFVLPEPMLEKETLNFCLWSCTLEQILSYPIDKFLIPCYHQNLKGNVKHILFQHKPVSNPIVFWNHLVIASAISLNLNDFFLIV